MFTLQDAIDLATFAHRNQYDKAGMPYIQHPLRVLESVKADGARPYVQMAAVLHDVTEDQPFTCEMLTALGVPEAAVDIVRLLDRGLSAIEYQVEREKGNIACTVEEFYYIKIARNPGALIVKKADIGDNMLPWRLAHLTVATQDRLRDKYTHALKMLEC